MDLSFIIPTRDRPEELAKTLEAIACIPVEYLGQAEVVVVDNASRVRPVIQEKLVNGVRVRVVPSETNLHAGARNIAAHMADGDWLVMLDDDSHPLCGPIESVLRSLDSKCAAIGGEILLPNGKHESGGLPEVIVGCGCAVRREAFLKVGGYDARFGYYAEEYDLCARLLLHGYRVTHTRSIRFLHRKVSSGRDFNEIIYRLVRNNSLVIRRYAPSELVEQVTEQMVSRYRQIAVKEDALGGYDRALDELSDSPIPLERREMPMDLWNRFNGLEAVMKTLAKIPRRAGEHELTLVGPELGKGRETILEACRRSDLTAHSGSQSSNEDRLNLIATLSPGPMLDVAIDNPNAVQPWELGSIEPSCATK